MILVEFGEAEKCVEDRLRRFSDIANALNSEMADRASPGLASSLGNSGMGGRSGPGNPTLNRVLAGLSPIESVEIPDKYIERQTVIDGKTKVRRVKVLGCIVQRPLHWVYLIEQLQDLFDGLPEGIVLKEYYIDQKDLAEVAEKLNERPGKVKGYAEKVKGVAIGLAIIGGLL